MSKLAELNPLWIEDSEVYVADKLLYKNETDFLLAVIDHIQELVDRHSEEECGWFDVPNFDEYLPQVRESWVVHRINCEWRESPFWELVDEAGHGHKKVWLIDFNSRRHQ